MRLADIRHPALREERAHLDETLSLVAAQLAVGEEELIQAQHELKAAFTYDRDNRDVLELRNLLFERAQQTVRHLKAARLKPYFTRINFTEEPARSRFITSANTP